MDMLHYFAEQERTTISHVLTRELDDLASANAEKLSAAIPGFGVALGVLNGNRRESPSLRVAPVGGAESWGSSLGAAPSSSLCLEGV